MAHPYLDPLPHGTTLEVYQGTSLVFRSSGRWLMPLFELERFLETYAGPKDDLYAHDTAIGKAAVVLMARCGVRHIHANLASRLALAYATTLEGMTLTADRTVDKLLCATEDELEKLTDAGQMYFLLRRRAKLVMGVEVRADRLTLPYGQAGALTFALQAGDHLMVEGENGSGKTTLLRTIAGIIPPASGTITVDGKAPSLLPRNLIGYIPQTTDTPLFSLSVEEVVALGLHRNDPKAVAKALDRVGALPLAGRDFSSLSGGEKQKVSLARCLAQKAKLLLFDEPTAALDARSRTMVEDILASLTVSEIPTIIVVTHDPELASLRGWGHLLLGEAHA